MAQLLPHPTGGRTTGEGGRYQGCVTLPSFVYKVYVLKPMRFFYVAFFLRRANTKNYHPCTFHHHALVRLQPFQAHRPVQSYKMGGGLQLPAVHEQQAVDPFLFRPCIKVNTKNVNPEVSKLRV